MERIKRIELGPDDRGQFRVLLDGHNIAGALCGVTCHVEPGRLPEVTLDVVARPVVLAQETRLRIRNLGPHATEALERELLAYLREKYADA